MIKFYRNTLKIAVFQIITEKDIKSKLIRKIKDLCETQYLRKCNSHPSPKLVAFDKICKIILLGKISQRLLLPTKEQTYAVLLIKVMFEIQWFIIVKIFYCFEMIM